MSTQDGAYADRLARLQGAWWKKLLPVQLPYRRNIRRVCAGRVLDVGCGLGRNLLHLGQGSVGVDHNTALVQACRDQGAVAYTPEVLLASPHVQRASFDALLLAHVVEHLTAEQADEVLVTYLPYLRPGGVVHLITPQERGQAFDPTHLRFCDTAVLGDLAHRHGLRVERSYSFPFPRAAGRVFVYNEFNVVARLP